MLVAGVTQVVGIGAGGCGIVTMDELRNKTSCDRIVTLEIAVAIQVVELQGLVNLQDEAGRREHVRRQMRRVGVAHDHRGEGVGLHLAEQVQPIEPLQIVEAVAALQILHLDLEDIAEGGSEHATERHDLLRPDRRSRDRHC